MIIYTAVLVILAVIFAVTAIKTGDDSQWILFAVCLVALSALYYMPYSNARISAASFDRGMDFEFELYDEGVYITPECRGKKEIAYTNISKAIELYDYFIIVTDNRFFPIPKSFMEEEQIKELAMVLENRLGKKFKYQR